MRNFHFRLFAFALGIGVTLATSAAPSSTPETSPPQIATRQWIEETRSLARAGDWKAAHSLGKFFLYDRTTCTASVRSGFKRVDEHELDSALARKEPIDGLTFACDANEALPWLKIAAETRNPEAMNDLGVALDELRQDTKALPWYILAATAGHDKAQLNLAMMLFQGRGGLEVDMGASYFWLSLAEGKRTLEDAKSRFRRLWIDMDYLDRKRAGDLFLSFEASGEIPRSAIPELPPEPLLVVPSGARGQ